MFLISGITGFVGQNLKTNLELKYRIDGLSRGNTNKSYLNYDSLTTSELNKYNAFIHLAGKAHDLKNTSNENEYFDVNTDLTKKMFDLFLESTCDAFIYMSSVKAVADIVENPLYEDVVPNPITAYGKSKLAAEKYILSKKLPLNKRVYILRPCMIHGPGNKGNLNLLYSFISKGIPYPFGAFKNKRSFLSIDNLLFVIESLITNNNITSGVYNVADDTPLSTTELVDVIGSSIGKNAKILKVPRLIVALVAKIGDLLTLPVNSERVQKLTENYIVSNSKIKRAIGKELPLTSKNGLIKTIKSF